MSTKRGERITPTAAGLLRNYEAEQRKRWAPDDTGQTGQYRPQSTPQVLPPMPVAPRTYQDEAVYSHNGRYRNESLIDKLKKPWAIGAVAVIATGALGFGVWNHLSRNGDSKGDQASAVLGDITIVDTSAEQPAGNVEALKFKDLFDGYTVKLGSLNVSLVEGAGTINFTNKDNSTGSVKLSMDYQQSIELYAAQIFDEKLDEQGKPILDEQGKKQYTPRAALQVTKDDDGGYTVSVDRSLITVGYNYALQGYANSDAFTTGVDPNTSAAAVTLKNTDTQDKFQITYLPASAPPINVSQPAAEHANIISADESGAVNALATSTDSNARTIAKMISLKAAISAVSQSLGNQCFASAEAQEPQQTVAAIAQNVDFRLRDAIEDWGIANKQPLRVRLTGEYKWDTNTVLAADDILANLTDNNDLRMSIRDINHMLSDSKAAQVAKYFGVTGRLICTLDEELQLKG